MDIGNKLVVILGEGDEGHIGVGEWEVRVYKDVLYNMGNIASIL